jgi:hypothetical protein
MGTHGVVNFINYRHQVIASLVRTSDGNPAYFGRQLFDYFGDWKVSNGTTGQRKHSNGMGCFAAKIVSSFKTEEGEFHLVLPSLLINEYDYDYDIFQNYPDSPLQIQLIKDRNTCSEVVLYNGLFSEFGKWLDKKHGPSPFTIYLTPPENS